MMGSVIFSTDSWARSTGPRRRQIHVDLDTKHNPKFLRLRLCRDSEQTERGKAFWDGEPLGFVNANLPETHPADFDFPVSPRMNFEPGRHLLELEVLDPPKPVRWLKALSLQIPDDMEEPASQHNPDAVEFHTITSHCDFAWRHTRAWHERRYVRVVRSALALLREYPHYIFQLETKREMLDPFMKWARRRAPGLIDELKAHLDSGRLEVVCAFSNPRLSEVYPETIVRNMILGRQYFRRLAPNYAQEVYNAVDVMPGCSQMPQICQLAGYSYYMFTRPMGRQVVFTWRGLDGSLLLSSRSGYSIGHDLAGITPACARLYRPPVERVMIGCDDGIPAESLARDATTWDPARKRVSAIKDYFEAVKQHQDKIDVVGPILDSLCTFSTAGLQGEHNLYVRNNQNEDLLLCAESLSLLADTPSGPQEMEPFWERLLENTGHAMCHVFAEDFRRLSISITRNRKRLNTLIDRELGALGAAVGPDNALGRPVIVANRLGWARSGVVSLDVPHGGHEVLSRDGAPVPVEFDGGRTLRFLAADVPSLGYTTFYLRKSGKPQATARGDGSADHIENDRLAVSGSPDGLLSIHDRGSGQVLGRMGDIVFRPAAPPQGGWMLLGPFGEAERCEWDTASIRSLISPARQVLTVAGRIRNSVVTRSVCLYPGSRRLDVTVSLDSRDRQDGVFRFVAPFDHAGELTAGIPFGAERRSDFDKELFREEFFVRGYPNGYHACRWTDYSWDGYGVTFVCPHGAFTGYDFDPCARRFEFTLLRARSTNETAGGIGPDQMYGQGLHLFTCALAPHAGTWRDARTFRDALELHNPLVSKVASPRRQSSKRATTSQAFLSVDAPNVVVSSARAIAGDECEVRIYEACGQDTAATLELSRTPRAALAVDFLGQPVPMGQPPALDGSRVHLRVAPWKIMTLRLRF